MQAEGALWRAPHLPFFLLAALWAGLVPLVWPAPGLVCDPVAWHRQELVLGVAGAAMAGYLLTALPHWTGGGGAGPWVTRGLALAWVTGRVLGGPCLPDTLALVGLCLLPVALAAALALPVIAARVWGRLPMALAPLVLIVIGVRLRLDSDGLTAGLGLALLVALVGGRILPAFLHARAGADSTTRLPVPVAARAADLMLALALAGHLAEAGPRLVGVLLLVAALGQALRMARWPLAQGLSGWPSDLVALLAAWVWLPVGLALVGLSHGFATGLPLPAALHALTMGLMGSMILAVMARAWARRVPGALRLGPVLALAIALVHVAAILRLGQPDPTLAAVCWSAGWALACAAALVALFCPVSHPVLSARRAHPSVSAENGLETLACATCPCPSGKTATSKTGSGSGPRVGSTEAAPDPASIASANETGIHRSGAQVASAVRSAGTCRKDGA